jgi:glucokinase
MLPAEHATSVRDFDAMTPTDLALVADIGGTNARFALTDPDAAGPRLIETRVLACADFASLHHAAEHYLARVGKSPSRASLAVACPVQGDEVRLTNRAWAFSRSELRRTLGLESLGVINDFGAIAWAVPALDGTDLLALYGDAALPQRGPISLVGPGTGLGIGLLVGDRERNWVVVETEGGHVSFAPQSPEEQQIAAWICARYGRASTERLLSGAGLSHIDAALREVPAASHLAGGDEDLRDPAQIVAAALEGHDVVARRALARFCAVLGSVAGDTALIHGARHVVIAGGIVPRFVPFLRSSAFRERFLAKGRFADHLAQVPIHVVSHPMPGLLGAAVALRLGIGLDSAP